MKRTLTALASASVLALLAACGGGGDDTTSITGDPADVPLAQAPALVKTFAAHFNAARAVARNCGTDAMPAVPPLTKWNPKLQQAAQDHANDMQAKGYFSHERRDGKTLESYGYTAVAGDILARGSTDPSTLAAGWLDSPGHCRAIMDGTLFTISAAQNSPYTVVIFGQ